MESTELNENIYYVKGATGFKGGERGRQSTKPSLHFFFAIYLLGLRRAGGVIPCRANVLLRCGGDETKQRQRMEKDKCSHNGCIFCFSFDSGQGKEELTVKAEYVDIMDAS